MRKCQEYNKHVDLNETYFNKSCFENKSWLSSANSCDQRLSSPFSPRQDSAGSQRYFTLGMAPSSSYQSSLASSCQKNLRVGKCGPSPANVCGNEAPRRRQTSLPAGISCFSDLLDDEVYSSLLWQMEKQTATQVPSFSSNRQFISENLPIIPARLPEYSANDATESGSINYISRSYISPAQAAQRTFTRMTMVGMRTGNCVDCVSQLLLKRGSPEARLQIAQISEMLRSPNNSVSPMGSQHASVEHGARSEQQTESSRGRPASSGLRGQYVSSAEGRYVQTPQERYVCVSQGQYASAPQEHYVAQLREQFEPQQKQRVSRSRIPEGQFASPPHEQCPCFSQGPYSPSANELYKLQQQYSSLPPEVHTLQRKSKGQGQFSQSEQYMSQPQVQQEEHYISPSQGQYKSQSPGKQPSQQVGQYAAPPQEQYPSQSKEQYKQKSQGQQGQYSPKSQGQYQSQGQNLAPPQEQYPSQSKEQYKQQSQGQYSAKSQVQYQSQEQNVAPPLEPHVSSKASLISQTPEPIVKPLDEHYSSHSQLAPTEQYTNREYQSAPAQMQNISPPPDALKSLAGGRSVTPSMYVSPKKLGLSRQLPIGQETNSAENMPNQLHSAPHNSVNDLVPTIISLNADDYKATSPQFSTLESSLQKLSAIKKSMLQNALNNPSPTTKLLVNDSSQPPSFSLESSSQRYSAKPTVPHNSINDSMRSMTSAYSNTNKASQPQFTTLESSPQKISTKKSRRNTSPEKELLKNGTTIVLSNQSTRTIEPQKITYLNNVSSYEQQQFQQQQMQPQQPTQHSSSNRLPSKNKADSQVIRTSFHRRETQPEENNAPATDALDVRTSDVSLLTGVTNDPTPKHSLTQQMSKTEANEKWGTDASQPSGGETTEEEYTGNEEDEEDEEPEVKPAKSFNQSIKSFAERFTKRKSKEDGLAGRASKQNTQKVSSTIKTSKVKSPGSISSKQVKTADAKLLSETTKQVSIREASSKQKSQLKK